jgi:hypothetical protein
LGLRKEEAKRLPVAQPVKRGARKATPRTKRGDERWETAGQSRAGPAVEGLPLADRVYVPVTAMCVPPPL